jgi:hypothetical protein
MRKIAGYIVLFAIIFSFAYMYFSLSALDKRVTELYKNDMEQVKIQKEHLSLTRAIVGNLERLDASVSAVASQSAEIKKELGPAK